MPILGLQDKDRPTPKKKIPLEAREPGYYRGDPRTFWNRMGDLFREDPEKLITKSKNALAFSDAFGITPSEAYEYHDEISEKLFGEKLTTPELIGGLTLLPITMAIATNPLGVLLGVGTYQAIAEAESVAISLVKNKKYQVFRNRGVSDLLPEDISEVTREVVDSLDIIAKMVAARGVFKASPKLGTKIARKIMVENRLPRDLYVSGKDLKAELQRGNILPAEQMEFVKSLELKGAEYKAALKKGLHIKVPAEKVITITDRPWYAKFKKLFRISPYEEVRLPGDKKPTYEFATELAEEAPEKITPSGRAEVLIPREEGELISWVQDVAYEAAKRKMPLDQYLIDEEGMHPKLAERTVAELRESPVQRARDIIRASDEGWPLGFARLKTMEEFDKTFTGFKRLTETVVGQLGPDSTLGIPLESTALEAIAKRILDDPNISREAVDQFLKASEGYLSRETKKSLMTYFPEEEEVTLRFEEFVKTLPEKQRTGKKIEGVKRIFDLLEERYPKVEDKITRVLHAPLADRHAETQGGIITLSTVDAPTLGHEIGEILQPMSQFGRGKTITGKEAEDRDILSDAIAYILMEEAGLKTPRKRPSPELLEKAKGLLSGEKPEIPSPYEEDITEEAIREIKSPKTRIRLITGQTKVSDLIREDVAFKVSLRRAARETRHALSVGKKEGYEKAKSHYLELRDKAKKRIAQRRYVQKLVDNINRSLGNNIDFFYKEAIENLREGIDPHFRAKKTIGSKERMQRFFDENPDRLAEMPTKFMRELNKKPLNDYTIGDLQKISDEISKLRKLGRVKRGLKLVQERREFEETKDTIVETISRGGKAKEDIVVRDTKVKSGVRSAARALTLRPTRIFDRLDRGQQFSGPMHKFFYDEVNRGVDNSLRIMDRRFREMGEKRKSLGISPRDLRRTRKVGEVNIALDEMLDVYAGWKNPRKKLALIYGNNISEKLAAEIASKLTPKEKEFADLIISEYEQNYSRVREAHIGYANEDMGHETFYTPIRRMDVTPNKYKSELAEEILVRNNLKKAYVGKQFTIERKNIPREFQRPIRLGLYNTWLDQVPKQERYINLGEKVKKLQRMSSDPDFRQAVRDNFGPSYLEAVEAYNNRVANPQIYKAFTRLEKGSQTLRKNMVLAYLAYNLVTMGKQLPSVLLYLPESGPWHLIAAGLQLAANPLETIKFVGDKDPQVKHRMIERELEEMKYSGRIMKMWGRFGMLGIKGVDKLAVTTGWLAVYNRNVGRLGEEEAFRLAQNATLRTQPAAHAKDLSQLYTSSEFLNWALQFTNQLNQIYNIATYDLPQDIKRGRLYKAFLSSLALATVSLVIWTMSNRRIPEDKEDVLDALLDEAMMAVPLVGRTIAAASKGWEQPSPAFKMGVAVGRLVTETEREAKARALVEASLVMMGIPYTEPRRVIKAIERGEPLELLGPRKEKEKKRKRY